MRGILVTNGFWKSASMAEMTRQLLQAADRLSITLTERTNDELLCLLPQGTLLKRQEADFYLFWDKDIRLALALEGMGQRLFNPARAIALCDDKTLTHLHLSQAGLPSPETILCPMTFPGLCYPDASFITRAGQALSWPLVIKEGCGSFGQQVYLANNAQEARGILEKAAGKPLLFQRFIKESAGTDLRLYMVGGQCIAAMRRRNDTDFRANIRIGGHGEGYTPTREETSLAAQACQALGLDFAGVDLLQTENGPVICEVNSNAHFTALSALTKTDIAGAILSHIQEALCAAG